MAKTPTRERHKDDFLTPIEWAFRNDAEPNAEQIAKAVFQLLSNELDHGEIRKVISAPPRELKALWPETATASS